MKEVTFKTPSGRTLITNMPDELPDNMTITEADFDKALELMKQPPISMGTHEIQ